MPKLLFIGTRGEIEARTILHNMHSSLLISADGKKIMVDCGLDWLGKFQRLKPDAIVLTHAHPDHAWGLKNGAPCPVYAPERTWNSLENCEAIERRTIDLHTPTEIFGITFEAFPVEHSLRCPAVGYRISWGGNPVFYSPDVVYIPERAEALAGVDTYIGDGASMARSFVRRRGNQIFGHAPVRTQLTWCQKENVPRAIFTHCGLEIVTSDPETISTRLTAWARERSVQARVAFDKMEIPFESSPRARR